MPITFQANDFSEWLMIILGLIQLHYFICRASAAGAGDHHGRGPK